MSFKSKDLPSASNTKRPDPMEPGSYPARLVQLIGLGVQPQRAYKGEEKPPRLSIRTTYEFLDEFMKDEEGEDILDKPRWLSEELPFMSLKADMAKSTKRYYALDPEERADGDWAKLVGLPCMVTIVNETDKRPGNDTVYDKIAAVSAMRPKEAAKAPELVNPPLIWDFYDPDIEVFNGFPDWIKDKIKGAVDYDGSALQKALEGGQEEKPKAPKADKKKPSTAAPDELEGEGEDW